ncbi:hypothetical protein ACG94M_04920 [Acinetobacter guillouiae]|uniref:hypothetical protein n=1 Tax=Acinetobacter guillouiae TaxID=106649 RepID=UPI003AF4D2DE
MTMLVLINYKDGVILAADKRAVWKNGSEVSHVVSDEVDKIYTWNGGYITGCGYAPLLENVKNFASSNNIQNVSEIIEYLKMVIESNTIHEKWINSTKFALIYRTSDNFRATTISANNYESRVLGDGAVTIIIEGVDTNNYKAKLEEAILQGNFEIGNVINILSDLFQYASNKSNTVSSIFDISLINIEGRGIRKIEN